MTSERDWFFRIAILGILSTCGLSAGLGLAAATTITFPVDYLSSRTQFRDACHSVEGGVCGSFRIESPSDADLTVDYGYFSHHAKKLLILQSGIHGPEAPAGAAVQALFYNEFLQEYFDHDFDVLMIHALNPYGFKYWRRTDEFNVNLNRNFSNDGQIFKALNPGYRDLRGLFEREGPAGNVWLDSLLSHVRFVATFTGQWFDKRYINQAMNAGQYEFPRGLNFGGKRSSAQVAFLIHLLQPLTAEHAANILFLDLHTGLGPAGALQLMVGKAAPGPVDKLGQVIEAIQDPATGLISAGRPHAQEYYTTTGDVVDILAGLSPHPENTLGITMEYGTMPAGLIGQLRSASRLVLENQAHFNGCARADICTEIQTQFREMFNPPAAEWREQVVSRARAFFTALLKEI